MRLKIAAALAALATCGNTAAPTTPIPAVSGPENVTEIALADERYRRMTVPVVVNGQGPYDFMIDTGAQATVLSNGLADQLGLHNRGRATLVGVHSSRSVETAIVPELTFGSGVRYNARAALVEPENIGSAQGILGLDSLQDQRVLLDFQNLRMHVGDSGQLGENRDYDIVVRARRIGDQLIIARARVDGVRTAVIIDTGAQGSFGNAALERRLRRARTTFPAEMTDINGIQLTGEVRLIRELELDRARLANFGIAFARSPMFAALGLDDEPAMVLGMSELRMFERVAIDFATRRVLFDLPDGSTLPSFDRFSQGTR